MRRHFLPQLAIAFFFGISTPGKGAYGLGPSTGTDLPYSVQFKNNLKNLHHNASFIGGQVIALRDTPGKEYSGNYIDVGDLGGVKRGDVFALFSPNGEPVGFIKITEVQRYTSSFEFLELTVNPSDELEAKKVTNEIRDRLPSMLAAHPDMRRYHKGVRIARTKQAPSLVSVPLPEVSPTNASVLPPLPGQSTASLPPLPGAAPSEFPASGLPPLPGAADNSASPASAALPPLPGVEPETNSVAPPLPQNTLASSSALPPLPADNSVASGSPNGLPPLSADTGALPPVPSMQGLDNSATGLPPLPEDKGAASSLPPISTDNSAIPPLPAPDGMAVPGPSDSGLPALPVDNNSGTPPAPVAPDSGLPALPAPSTAPAGIPDNSLPSLPGMDNNSPAGLPPLPQSELPGVSPEPVAENPLPVAPGADLNPLPLDNSQASLPSPGMDFNSALPGEDLPAPQPDMAALSVPNPSMDTGLPTLPADNTALLPMSGDQVNVGLPGSPDNGLPVPAPLADNSVPTLPDNSMAALSSQDGLSSSPVVPAPDMLPSPEGLPGASSPVIPDSNLAGLPNPSDTAVPAIPGDSMAALPMNVPQPSDNGLPTAPPDLNTPALPPSLQNDTLPPAPTDLAMGDPSLLPPPVMDNALPPAGLEGLPSGGNDSLIPPVPLVSAGATDIPGLDDFEIPGVSSSSGVASSAEAVNLGLPPIPARVNGRFLQDIPTFTSQSPKPSA